MIGFGNLPRTGNRHPKQLGVWLIQDVGTVSEEAEDDFQADQNAEEPRHEPGEAVALFLLRYCCRRVVCGIQFVPSPLVCVSKIKMPCVAGLTQPSPAQSCRSRVHRC